MAIMQKLFLFCLSIFVITAAVITFNLFRRYSFYSGIVPLSLNPDSAGKLVSRAPSDVAKIDSRAGSRSESSTQDNGSDNLLGVPSQEQLNHPRVLPAHTEARAHTPQTGSSGQTSKGGSLWQPSPAGSGPAGSASGPATVALQINPVQISPDINSANFGWKTTLPTNSELFITNGNTTATFPSTSGLSKTHSAAVTNLSPETLYNYLIHAAASDGQDLKVSGQFQTLPKQKQNYTFSTLGFAVTATKNSVIAVLHDPSLVNPKFTMTLKGPENQTYSPVTYKNPGGNYVWEVSGLKSDTNYNYTFSLSDDNYAGGTNGVIKTAAGP